MVLSVGVLVVTFTLRLTADMSELHECMKKSADVKHNALHVEKLMLVQEALIISTFFASLLTLLFADRMFTRSAKTPSHLIFVTKKDGTVREVVRPVKGLRYAYDYKMRSDTIRSLPSVAFVILALLNYSFGYYFKSGMQDYASAESKAVLEPDCSIPGSSVLSYYSQIMVLVPDTAALLAFVLAFFVKFTNALILQLCPGAFNRCIKRCRGLPHQPYSHYENEF